MRTVTYIFMVFGVLFLHGCNCGQGAGVCGGSVPEINGPDVYGVWPGTAFLYTIPATGSKPIEYSVKGLPRGLSVDSKTGFITGSISKAGEYIVRLRARNAFGKIERKFHIICGEQLALTPPVGWMGWNLFGCDVNEDKMKSMADAMVESGMRDAGYQYINIDDCWAFKRAEDGSIIVDKKRFPSGIKNIADYVHARGLKLGLYSDAATHTCAGALGSYGYEEQDAGAYAEWGVDYLKYDYCGAPSDAATAKQRYSAMAEALRKSGRSIVFSVCEWGPRKPWLWAAEAGGNLWRTTWDIRDMWETEKYNNGQAGIMNILDHQVGLAKYAGPGRWNDPDMLIVGLYGMGGPSTRKPGGCTDTEYRSNMSLWCLLASPLFTSCDLRGMNEVTKDILTNTEVLAVNQDPLGKQADRMFKDGELEIWAKDLADGSKAVGLLNRDEKPCEIRVNWSQLGISGKQMVRDLWKCGDVGVFEGSYKAIAEPHEVVLVKISAVK